jgi:hypothetical protein
MVPRTSGVGQGEIQENVERVEFGPRRGLIPPDVRTSADSYKSVRSQTQEIGISGSKLHPFRVERRQECPMTSAVEAPAAEQLLGLCGRMLFKVPG